MPSILPSTLTFRKKYTVPKNNNGQLKYNRFELKGNNVIEVAQGVNGKINMRRLTRIGDEWEEDEEGTDLIQMQVIIDYLLADDKHPVIALMFQKKLTSNTPS
jgi:hypothetical protein|tara:strand:+ start:470 stop:778 length:309 start_codon:yes stop_codon:yes gene_type:complete